MNEIHDYASANGIDIRFVGLFDTVFAMGLPNETELGFTTTVPPGVPTYHAMAINEERKAFRLQRQRTDANAADVYEVWFTGVHSNIGGGYSGRGLSDITLGWMVNNAITEGVPVASYKDCPNPNGKIRDSYGEFVTGLGFFSFLSNGKRLRLRS